jgi:hypothetical protein
MITMNCPTCNEALSIPDEYAGQAGACKKCGARIVATAGTEDTAGLPDDLAAALDASFSTAATRPIVSTPTLGERIQPILKPVGLVIGVLAVAGLALAGLARLPEASTESRPGPGDVTRDFMAVSMSGDTTLWEPYVTSKSWELLGQAAGVPNNMPPVDSYTIGAANVSGSAAEVSIQVTQLGTTVTNDVLLRDESGGWRVYGIRVSPMPGMNMTIDFENPQAMMEEMAEMMEKMTPEMMEQMMKGAMQQ